MILKMNALFGDLAQLRQRKNLVAATVGENRTVPVHEPVQPAEMFDYINSRPNKQVIGVSENNLRLQFAQLERTHRFHASLGTDRNERGSVDYAMRRHQPAAARAR